MSKTTSKIALIISLFLGGVSLSLQAAVLVDIPPSQIQGINLSVEQLQQAAEAGDPDAQYALGYLYYSGKTLPQDTPKGLQWIKRASVQGQEQAIVAMRMLQPGNTSLTASKLPNKAAASPAEDNSLEQNNQLPSTVSTGVSPPKAVSKTTLNRVNPVAPASRPDIQRASGNYYTIQLLVTSSKAELNRYIQTYALGSKASDYPVYKNGRESYLLLYGIYKTRAEAQASVLTLPAAVRAQKPWIKQINQVRGAEKKQS